MLKTFCDNCKEELSDSNTANLRYTGQSHSTVVVWDMCVLCFTKLQEQLGKGRKYYLQQAKR